MTKFIIPLLLLGSPALAQVESVSFTEHGSHQYSFFYSSYTSNFDVLDRPYVFSASNELGLICFDINDIDNPTPVDTITTQQLDGLNVSNLHQVDDIVYLALGGFQGFVPQDAGCAAIDVSDPENMEILDVWSSPDYNQGAAIVLPEEDYAYLGAMDSGLLILDISAPGDIQFVSHILPDPNFPQEPGLFSVPNARGMDKDGDILYVCNDAGGMRAIDVQDPANPEEIGLYMNWVLEDIGQPAYNNAVIRDGLLYAAVDYCGWDVIDISDPTNLELVAWYNPWDCDSTNWDGRPGHTNQVNLVDDLDLLFFSAGDSEVLVYEISNPGDAQLVGSYATLNDDVASWGMNVRDDLVAVSYVNNPIGIPYDSSFGGIGILSWQAEIADNVEEAEATIRVFPNPGQDRLYVQSSNPLEWIMICSLDGKTVKEWDTSLQMLDISDLSSGVYCIRTNLGSTNLIKIQD